MHKFRLNTLQIGKVNKRKYSLKKKSFTMGYSLKIVYGDLFSAKVSLAHCVGADFRMGMGIAVKFRDLFGQVDYLKKLNVSLFQIK